VHKQERVNAVIDRATAELLSGAHGKRIQRRLEDIAYYMVRAGRREQAGWAAAAAARLREGIDATKILFFQAFIRTQLGTVAAAEQQKAEEEPRLIMTPAEAMRAREAREARTRRR
jgi:mannose/cellobiose epimerase-like protein (N-acyl-D-glucosamine 2-epimerase family)